MSKDIIIRIPYKLPTLNYVINSTKKHWSKYAKEKYMYTMLCANCAKKYMVKNKITSPIDYQIKPQYLWHVASKRGDSDNIEFAKKYILDGFVLAGLIIKDNLTIVIGSNNDFVIDGTWGVDVKLTKLQKTIDKRLPC